MYHVIACGFVAILFIEVIIKHVFYVPISILFYLLIFIIGYSEINVSTLFE